MKTRPAPKRLKAFFHPNAQLVGAWWDTSPALLESKAPVLSLTFWVVVDGSVYEKRCCTLLN